MMFFIVQQDTKEGPVEVKVIGNAPNTENKPNKRGEVKPFISIPPIVRVFIGSDNWGSPDVMPDHDDPDQPTVWKLTLNPRTNNFNLHYPPRLEIDHTKNIRKIVKEGSGSLSMHAMHRLLSGRIGEPLASQIVTQMIQTVYASKMAS